MVRLVGIILFAALTAMGCAVEQLLTTGDINSQVLLRFWVPSMLTVLGYEFLWRGNRVLEIKR